MNQLDPLARLVRYYILESTTAAGSGHPTTSMSATDLTVGLLFGGVFKADLNDPSNVNNDRLIFSKGHAAPLLYALYGAAGRLTEEELLDLRKFGSPLEGHPTMAFPYTESATGSLGQGLSIGIGMAMNAKYVDELPYRTYVLTGDSELAEGSIWEALQIGAHYELDNIVAIADVNRLGQRGETLYGHDVEAVRRRIAAFGWETIVIDGHDLDAVVQAFETALTVKGKPVYIIARTLKGKGVPFLEDKNGWHGKAAMGDDSVKAIAALGDVDRSLRGTVAKPETREASRSVPVRQGDEKEIAYSVGDSVATRRAYGDALVRIFPKHPNMVVLDAEVSNSTYSDAFQAAYPDRFFEMFVAEQNMVGTALGFSRRGKKPFVSTFAAFLTRAFDQIRMSQYSNANITFAGSHAGVSIGEDGASQMGLEDLGMFRAVNGSAVLYPSDAASADKLVEETAKRTGVAYIRTTRMATPVLYDANETFPIGGSKTVRESDHDAVTVIGAGVTLHEALAAYDELDQEGITIRVIDLYSVKPVDVATLRKAAEDTQALLTVEDHYPEGGIGEAVRSAFDGIPATIYSLAVRRIARTGKPEELLDYVEISRSAIAKKVREIVNGA